VRRADDAAREHAKRRTEKIRRIVDEAIHDPREAIGRMSSHAEYLSGKLHVRLEEPEFYPDLTDAPLGEMVARICRDLGLDPDWRRWEDEPWARAEAAAKTPGSPYAEPSPERGRRASPGGTRPPPAGHDPPQ
jgi:hypothetical protein